LLDDLAKTQNSFEQKTEARDIAIETKNKLREYNKLYYGQRHKKPIVYKEGDYVLVRNFQKKARMLLLNP